MPLGLKRDGELTILVESHLPGRRLKDIRPREVDGPPDMLERIVDWLVEFTQARGVERVPVDASFLRAHVDEPVREYQAAFETLPHDADLLASLSTRLRDALGDEAPVVAAHGDLCDANVLVAGDSVGVVDWDEPFGDALPGYDLFYLLCSLAATRGGLGRREGFERGFRDAFFRSSPLSRRFAGAWETYRSSLRLQPEAGLPLFALAWVRFALHKLHYLEASGELAGSGAEGLRRMARPQSSYPITFFLEGRCLNVSLTAELLDDFAL